MRFQDETRPLPDGRHGAVAELIARRIVASQSPLVTQIARGAGHPDETAWSTCQAAYRRCSDLLGCPTAGSATG